MQSNYIISLEIDMTSATESEVMIQLNERQIYDLEWLEDCYKKVRFPNPKCEDFLTEINKTLSNKIRGEYNIYIYYVIEVSQFPKVDSISK